VRVIAYNILEGGDGRLPQLARILRSGQPDVVALVEATRQNAERLARELELVFG
jgi:hypothetical protein